MMSEFMMLVAALSLGLVAPMLIIANFILKLRQGRGLNVDDERMLSDVWQSSKRMEERIRNLERILDTEHRDWRKS